MFNRLNYFNKLICVFLISLCIIFCKNTYINLLLIILPFAYAIFTSNYKLTVICAVSFFLFSIISNSNMFLWPYKIWQIFVYIVCLKSTFTERDRIALINRLFYKIKSTKKMIRKLFYNNLYKNNKKSCSFIEKVFLRKYNKKKTEDELKNKFVIAKTKYYGNSKRRKEYGLTTWSKTDSTVLCLTIFLVIISILY